MTFASALLRLYPRRWRERYGDEMRALLAETRVTPAVLTDLLIGATREWARTLIAPPELPVSMDAESWRGFRRALSGMLVIGSVATFIGRELAERQLLNEDHSWILMLGMAYAVSRTLLVQIRHGRLHYRKTLGYMPPVSPEQMIAVGLRRSEFWICLLLLLISTSGSWASPMRHSWEIAFRWSNLFFFLNILEGSTRDYFGRQQLLQRAIAERQPKGTA